MIRAPKNVRVVMRDGTVTRVQVVYWGLTDDGLYEWRVAGRFELHELREVLVEELPPRTTIALQVRVEPPGPAGAS